MGQRNTFNYSNPVKNEFKVGDRTAIKTKSRKSKSGSVLVSKIDKEVWAKAMHLSSGDVRRIKRISAEEVVVMNNPIHE